MGIFNFLNIVMPLLVTSSAAFWPVVTIITPETGTRMIENKNDFFFKFDYNTALPLIGRFWASDKCVSPVPGGVSTII